eukprot:gnl/Dysnectes_brevis/1711_a1946_1332.p1 GENE.gnl/Dysnectes_brevis/1711_a1946_1332~~gnl/Dysnectes_brevis/1711_a1946_1332.p1  ORF type:complete len:743 (+),score=91.26 gnl/Dysnectes_brevis/1711_a1946_1332:57-2231(+)
MTDDRLNAIAVGTSSLIPPPFRSTRSGPPSSGDRWRSYLNPGYLQSPKGPPPPGFVIPNPQPLFQPEFVIGPPKTGYNSTKFQNKQPPDPDPIPLPVEHLDTSSVHSTPYAVSQLQIDMGTVVYDVKKPCPAGGGQGTSESFDWWGGPATDSLQFESRFESGNLFRALRINSTDYQTYCLLLRPDTGTSSHLQWFYFAVGNAVPGRRYRFVIINLCKSSSLYNIGMKPIMLVENEAEGSNPADGDIDEIPAVPRASTWRRVGENIHYGRNQFRRSSNKPFASLSFEVTFPSRGPCYLAHCYPYTYRRLQSLVSQLMHMDYVKPILTARTLTTTIAGNTVPLLTITAAPDSPTALPRSKRRGLLLSARIHPGETNSSWIMEGIVRFLVSNHPTAQLLREHFILKITPMMNPDGVIMGNYRCNLSGRDPNRQFRSATKSKQPVLVAIKQLVLEVQAQRPIYAFLDLHGHSRRLSAFVYACDSSSSLPRLLDAAPHFSLRRCTYGIAPGKENTGRAALHDMGVPAFCLETSFAGTGNYHFDRTSLQEFGVYIAKALWAAGMPVNPEDAAPAPPLPLPAVCDEQEDMDMDLGSNSESESDTCRQSPLCIKDAPVKHKRRSRPKRARPPLPNVPPPAPPPREMRRRVYRRRTPTPKPRTDPSANRCRSLTRRPSPLVPHPPPDPPTRRETLRPHMIDMRSMLSGTTTPSMMDRPAISSAPPRRRPFWGK